MYWRSEAIEHKTSFIEQFLCVRENEMRLNAKFPCENEKGKESSKWKIYSIECTYLKTASIEFEANDWPTDR